MKNVSAIISIATVAILLLLAVAASVIDSLPFAVIASYVIGFACAIQFLALFIADYSPRSPRPIPIMSREAEENAAAQRRVDQQADTPFSDPDTVMMLSTNRLRNGPATLSLS